MDSPRLFGVTLTLSGGARARRTGRIPDARAYVRSEESQPAALWAERGGALPRNIVTLDMINEPVVDRATVPHLRWITWALRRYAGLPVTVGGWSTPRPQGGPGVLTRPEPHAIAEPTPLVDVLAMHLYPDLQPGTHRSSTEPAAYLPYARAVLNAVINFGRHTLLRRRIWGRQRSHPHSPGTWGVGGSPPGRGGRRAAGAPRDRGRGALGTTIWQMALPPRQACEGTALACFNMPPQAMPALEDLARYER